MAIPELVGAAEVAVILGIGNTNFSHLRKQREGTDTAFPDPVVTLKCGPIWLKRDAEKFAKTFNPRRRAVKVEGSDTEVVKVATRKPVALAKPPSKKAPTKKAPAAKPPAKKKLSLVR